MAAPVKTESTALITHQAVTHAATVIPSWIDVSGMMLIEINLYHAIIEVGANTNPGAFYIQLSAGNTDAAANNDHVTAQIIRTGVLTAAVAAISGTEAIGSTTIEVDVASVVAAGDDCYIQDTGTETDSEWRTVSLIDTGTPDFITLLNGLTAAKDSSDKIWKAERWTMVLDVSAYQRLRVPYIHQGATGMNTAIKGTYGALTAIT